MSSSLMLKPNKDLMAIRISEIRDELGLSIAAMAERLGISKSTLNSYIRAIAMPPEEIVYKISIMSGKSIEWLKYGDEFDYIRQVIEFEGFSEFLADYPDTVDKVLESCQQYKVYPIENRYVSDIIVMQVFYGIYNPIFKEYIDEIIKIYVNEIHKYPLYTGDDDFQRFKYSNRVHLEISSMKNQVKYGDKEKILHVAETEFKNRVDFYFRNKNRHGLLDYLKIDKEPSFFPDFHKKMKEKNGAKEIVRYLAYIYKEDFKINSEISYEILEAFEELGVKLERIYDKYPKKELKKVFVKE